jgi:desmocollin 1
LGDEDNWFEIDEQSGDLRTVKVLDRESKFVRNNQYNVSVVATDAGECHFLEIKHLWDAFLR